MERRSGPDIEKFPSQAVSFSRTKARIPSICSLHLLQVPDNICGFKMPPRKHHSSSIGVTRLLSSILDKPNPFLVLPFLSYRGSIWDSYLLHVP